MRDHGYNISVPDQITSPQVIVHQDHAHITDFNILEHFMNSTEFSCGYDKPREVYWIRHADLTVGVVFMMLSIATLFVNAFVIYAFFTSKRSLQGTSLILVQVAFNDFISGIVGIVFCSNLLSDRTVSTYRDSKAGNIILCQVYGILLDIIYIAAPLLLAIATALRVFAVLSPYNYQKINTTYKLIPIGLSAMSWIFGAGVGLFPFLFGKWMCFSQVSGSCDYFVINVLGGDKYKTRIYSLCLFVLPGNIAYFVIVVGGMIVIGKLFRQNRKTVERTTSRMETVANARAAFATKSTKSRRASESELKMMQKELSVIKCTLTLCATYFVAHFVTVAYNVVYMFQTNNTVFRTMSGNSATGEVYLYSWFYLSHTLAGFIDGLVQIQCNNEMQREVKNLVRRVTSFGSRHLSDIELKGSMYTSVNRFATFTQ
ncbi:uncharacterized protein LOC134813948 isoform X2 [Bolinopsis microptera]|uniref:uncharacterized protein LOC134813948 isoform X2 n=2 Tax=Bolinopsis microptera TaxID=2820187 RepID=UPI00307B0CE1